MWVYMCVCDGEKGSKAVRGCWDEAELGEWGEKREEDIKRDLGRRGRGRTAERSPPSR